MLDQDMSRRALLKGGGAAIAGLGAIQVSGPAHAFPGEPGEEVIPWEDQPPPAPFPGPPPVFLKWEELDSFHTDVEKFFVVSHYGNPAVDAASWRLGIDGLVRGPQTLTLEQLKSRQRREVTFTLECSGNHGYPFVIGAIGNARWAGTPLAPLLRRAGVRKRASEVIFWGTDVGEVAILDNGGVTRADVDVSPSLEPDNIDLTIEERFARSMSLDEAMGDENLLCYEMNGAPLTREHGFPLRLIAPGWYGVANVKWLTRIEVTDQRFAGRFMAREYVTIRHWARDDKTAWTFNTVNHTRLKSAPAKVTRRRNRYSIMGAAWGAPISEVEVQIDDGRWRPARLDRQSSRRDGGFVWRFWTLEWGKASPGMHTIRSRAYDVDGNRQPAPDDPYLASRVTFWENNGQVARRVKLS